MNEHEKALPAGGPAKFTQNAVKIYVISSRERLLLPLAFCFCLLLVNTLLWSGPTAGLTASVCVWYGLLGALGSRTWLYPLFLYLLLLPLACVPPRQDSSPDNSSFRKEVDA